MQDNQKMLISRAARRVSVSMNRRGLQQLIYAFGRSWCGHSMVVAVLSLGIAACTWLPHAPSRVIPTTPPELTIDVIAMPDAACVGDVVTFAIRTTPGIECLGDIGYWNSKGSWVGPGFDPIVANEEGICRWTWTVTDEVLPGTAEFRAGVRGYGTMSSMVPQGFQVQVCAR